MKKEYLYILITAVLFSTMEVALKIAGVQFNSIQVTFLRFFIGGLFLLPFALIDLKSRKCRLTKGDWLYLFLLGVICICISMTFFQIGVMRTNANLASIIICMNPVFTMIFAHYLLADDRFTKTKGAVLVLNLLGLILAANPVRLFDGNEIYGVLLTLVAAITFGLYTALGRKKIDKLGGIAQTSLSFLIGSGVLWMILIVFHLPVMEGINVNNLLLFLYLGIFVTGIGYYCYFKAIYLCGPSTASLAFFMKPVFARIVAFLILGEKITLNLGAGILFILAGSFLKMWEEKHKMKK